MHAVAFLKISAKIEKNALHGPTKTRIQTKKAVEKEGKWDLKL